MLFDYTFLFKDIKHFSKQIAKIMGGKCPRFNATRMSDTIKKLKFDSLFGENSSSSEEKNFDQEWTDYMLQCTQEWEQEVDQVVKSDHKKSSTFEVGESSRHGGMSGKRKMNDRIDEEWDLDAIVEEDEEEMKEVGRKAQEIGECWRRTLLKQFQEEDELERMGVEILTDMKKKGKMNVGQLQTDSSVGKSSSLFSVLSSKYFACCSSKEEKELVKEVNITPSTEAQDIRDGCCESFRFDVPVPTENDPIPPENSPWWPKEIVPPCFCPIYGVEVCPTKMNFYLLEYGDDSEQARKRKIEDKELAVWDERSLVPIPEPYGYWNDASSGTSDGPKEGDVGKKQGDEC